jgi:integrase/recombinase XerC
MASLKNRRGSWYARVLWYVDDKQKEKQIPLRTSSKVTARERISIVNKYESDIKLGINFDFAWLSEGSTTKVKRFTLQDATDLWIKKRKGKMRASTIETNETSLSYFADCLGNAIPLKTIENNHIERFIDYLNGRGLSITSINIHLRTIKAMLRHYYKIGKLMKIPLIEQISQNKTEPIYITDEEFHRIMNVEWLGDFYKKVFLLYRETGMRLREPMMSTLDGNWIDIPNESKSGKGRNIELDDYLKSIFIELKEWLNVGYGSTLVDVGDHLSKKFKKCLREIGIDESKHFHSLRHTFAVRSLIRGTSIYQLKMLMGHSSVTTTEVYGNMNLKRIEQDFPTIVENSINTTKIGKMDTDLMDTRPLLDCYVA